MNERLFSKLIPIVAALSVALIVSSSARPSTANASSTDETPSTSTQIVTFEHSVSLDDAIKTASDLGETPEAFRFDNGNLIGEFSPDGPVPASEFISAMQKTYGVTPAFVGFSVRRPVAELASMTDDQLKPIVPVSSPELVALAATLPSNMGAPPSLESRAQATADTETESEADWRPDGAYLYTTNYGSFTKRAYFSHYYEWQSPSSLELLPAEHGLEFEVNLYNDDDWMVGSRPVCYIGPYAAYDHRARFWAINQNFTWSSYTASSFAGTDWYFDYNDFSDECGRNSMALGMRYPQVLQGTDFSI